MNKTPEKQIQYTRDLLPTNSTICTRKTQNISPDSKRLLFNNEMHIENVNYCLQETNANKSE